MRRLFLLAFLPLAACAPPRATLQDVMHHPTASAEERARHLYECERDARLAFARADASQIPAMHLFVRRCVRSRGWQDRDPSNPTL